MGEEQPPGSEGRGRRNRLRGPQQEDGSATVEAVLVFPVLMLVVLTIVQFTLHLHAQTVAEAAAQEALAAARQADGTEERGRVAGRDALATLGDRLLVRPEVQVSRGPATASATVTARVVSLVPGLTLDLRETAAGPVERFVEDRP